MFRATYTFFPPTFLWSATLYLKIHVTNIKLGHLEVVCNAFMSSKSPSRFKYSTVLILYVLLTFCFSLSSDFFSYMITVTPCVVYGICKNIRTAEKRISMCGMEVTAKNAFSQHANFSILLQFMGIVHTLQQANLFSPFVLIFLTLSVYQFPSHMSRSILLNFSWCCSWNMFVYMALKKLWLVLRMTHL